MAVASPLILAIFLGMAYRNLIGVNPILFPGISFAMKRVLRLAIILLGLQITGSQLLGISANGLAIIFGLLVATFVVTKWLGGLMGVDPKLAELIAAGTSICGASAVIAANTVTEAPEEDVVYGVACVTLFGTIATLVYPLVAASFPLSPHSYGLWAGASIHEVAQVVAAAYQQGPLAGETGTIAKLARVVALAPMILALGFLARRRSAAGGVRGRAPVPWFAFGFCVVVAVNSVVAIPLGVKATVGQVDVFLLSAALAAIGLDTDFRKVVSRGVRPMLLGAAASVFLGASAYLLIARFV